MPKNRRRNNRKGAKSFSIRTKHKIGGRKSSRGVKQLSTDALTSALRRGGRDRNKIERELTRRRVWFSVSDKQGVLFEFSPA